MVAIEEAQQRGADSIDVNDLVVALIIEDQEPNRAMSSTCSAATFVSFGFGISRVYLHCGRIPSAMTAELRIGTSAFTADGWETAFYPPRMKAADYLTFYATRFNTVEVDSTFYRTPSLSTVKGWYAKTPSNFLFALKVPQVITHERVLEACESDLRNFLNTVDALGEKLGPILFQFGYFNRSVFKSQSEFLARLKPFLAELPRGYRFAVEIRNKNWMDARLVETLSSRSVALALIDQSWVPRPWELNEPLDLITSDFAYVRLLGDRKGIEEQTKVWDKVIVNRTHEMKSWVDYLRPIRQRGVTIYIYVNNHYAGFAPETAEAFLELWDRKK